MKQIFKPFLTIMILFLGSMNAIAQFKLPEGYTYSVDNRDSNLYIKADFNKDGKKDLFAIISKEGKSKMIAFISNKKKYVVHQSKEMEYFDCCSVMEWKNNIMRLTSNGMRYFEYYKLRYNKAISNFELIGFDSESFGNAAHDGAGTQSLNLLNGNYKYSTYTATGDTTGTTMNGNKTIEIPTRFTITNFDQALEFVQNIDVE